MLYSYIIISICNVITLPFLGEIDLSFSILLIFFICMICVVAFEFVNGFHDTANAVATVIYTKALPPVIAIPWSGFFNFLGVFTGGVAVAMGILKLIPLNELMTLGVKVGACMVLSILIASIIWNLGTWFLGIPCSSSHTLIGSIIGASMALTFYYHGSGVNWDKAKEIGFSLIISPLLGFGAAALLMYLLRHVLKAESLFHIPQGEDRPPILVRLLLITTCTLVSFFHGSNDGQKGVGLLMLILIAFVPVKFALDQSVSKDTILVSLNNTEQALQKVPASFPGSKLKIDSVNTSIEYIKTGLTIKNSVDPIQTLTVRRQVQSVAKELKIISVEKQMNIPKKEKVVLIKASKDLEKLTDYAPVWVIATISISLGMGTMIGWKRIVMTIGEKIGKEHLNYAQGAVAEIVAAGTIGLSTNFGLPVSTTHVLSSGIAGGMVASKGHKNLNNDTLKSIALAWILTLPVSIILAIILFAFFHLFV